MVTQSRIFLMWRDELFHLDRHYVLQWLSWLEGSLDG